MYTPNQKTIEEVSHYLNVSTQDVVKTMVYKANEAYVCVLVRGDREVNLIKVCNALQIAEHELVLASKEEIEKLGSVDGFVGPCHMKIRVLVDQEVAKMKNIIVGANQKDYHFVNVNINRDYNGEIFFLRDCKENDLCPICKQPLKSQRGIEIGQIFKLKTKYSDSMGCTYLNEEGKNIPMVMGCYGIGVTRTLASIVEQYHDEQGIIWPLNVAPYHVVIIPIRYQNEQQELADSIYHQLQEKHVEVILDDRNVQAGVKFKDWDLIGIPMSITVGKRASEGIVEFKFRSDNQKQELTVDEVIDLIVDKVNKESR